MAVSGIDKREVHLTVIVIVYRLEITHFLQAIRTPGGPEVYDERLIFRQGGKGHGGIVVIVDRRIEQRELQGILFLCGATYAWIATLPRLSCEHAVPNPGEQQYRHENSRCGNSTTFAWAFLCRVFHGAYLAGAYWESSGTVTTVGRIPLAFPLGASLSA